MEPRTLRLGDTELLRIGLGTNRLTHTDSHLSFLAEAARSGIGMIDTAHIYTGGESERTIGDALRRREDDSLVVATKGGYAPGDGRPAVLRAQIDESLRRLRTECIDLYYLHRVDPQTPPEESLGAIRECQEAGKIRLAGISAVTVEPIERAEQVLTIAAVQNHYNLAQRESDEVIDHCAERGIAFVPYYPLEERHPALTRIAARHHASESQIVLAWLLRRAPVMSPIPGTLSAEHLRENIAALDVDLSDEECQELGRLSA